jgi:hypothetical protein
MDPIRCPATSVKDYHSTLRSTPEERNFMSCKCFATPEAMSSDTLSVISPPLPPKKKSALSPQCQSGLDVGNKNFHVFRYYCCTKTACDSPTTVHSATAMFICTVGRPHYTFIGPSPLPACVVLALQLVRDIAPEIELLILPSSLSRGHRHRLMRSSQYGHLRSWHLTLAP